MSEVLLQVAANDDTKKTSYRDFIHEAFIAPIRTAVVVDDEFPTLDELLENPAAAALKPHKEKAKAIIKFCRERRPFPWIVDVHDGKNISFTNEGKSATHFDHTDLLVLDYNLRGENEGGELAIRLLNQLASNTHFNLVIIYTNSDISQTLRDIGLGLTSTARMESLFKGRETAFLQRTIEVWDQTAPDILNELIASIDSLDFLKYVSYGTLDLAHIEGHDGFERLLELLTDSPVKFRLPNMFNFVMAKKFRALLSGMSALNLGGVEIDEKFSAEKNVINWIRADSLFVTVIEKTKVMPEQFTDCLLEAIEGWDPSPHRLIVSKMRSEIGKRGVVVEKEILQNPYLQSAWIRDFFIADAVVRRTNVQRNVNRHWESFGSKVETDILEYAVGLGDHLLGESVAISRFGGDRACKEGELTALHVNSYICSKPVEGHHIFTGHIFKTDGGEYWVCLTPACDLEPGRKDSNGPNKHLGDWMPFKAAQIIPMPSYSDALINATRGYHLFLCTGEDEIGSPPKAYTFFSDPGVEQSVVPTLRWQQFYAKNQGIFLNHNNDLVIARSSSSKEGLVFLEQKCIVVAQLRYEYALNLLQKLGGHLSRVGLDFVNSSAYVD